MNNSHNIFQAIDNVKVEPAFKNADQQIQFYNSFTQEMRAELNKNEEARQESEQKARSTFVG